MDPASNRESRLRFALLCTAQFMLILDVVVVNVALPSMRDDLAIAGARLPLVGVSYTLTFGALLIVFGRAGDFFGRRRLFLAGVATFGIASLAAGAAQNEWMLFAGRAAQGIGAAMVSPSALALVLATFPHGAARNRALGVWGAVGSAGAVAGQVIGGTLVSAFGWRSIFLINIPVAAVVVVCSIAAFVDPPRSKDARRLDLVGAAMLTTVLIVFTMALIHVAEHGADLFAGLLVAGSAALLAVLWRLERRHPAPLLDPQLIAVPVVRLGNLILVLNAGVTAAALFFTTLYLQTVLGMSPMAVGAAFAPVTLLVLAISPLAGKLVSRFGAKPLLVAGAVAGILGLVRLAQVPVAGTYIRDVLPGLSLVAIMGGLSYAPTFIAGTAGITTAQHGLASGLLSTAQELGAAIGLTAISTVALLAAGGQIDTYRAGYVAGAGACIVVLLLSARLPLSVGIPSTEDTGSAKALVDIGGSR